MSLYKRFIDLYWKWYIDTEGLQPRISAADGKSLKMIIDYFLKLSNKSEEQAVDAWRAVLSRWHMLPAFYAGQKDLKQINGNINAIIRHVKAAKKNGISEAYRRQIFSDLQP